MNFDRCGLASRPTEAVLGFEQYGFGVAVLRVRCNPALDELAYFPPCTADPDLALVTLPDGWLTHGALTETARVYLRCHMEPVKRVPLLWRMALTALVMSRVV